MGAAAARVIETERRPRPVPKNEDWVLRQHIERLRAGTAPEESPPVHLGASPVMPPESHDAAPEANGVQRTIGRLEATVDELRNAVNEQRNTVQALISTWRVQEREAVEDRRRLHDKMDETATQIEKQIDVKFDHLREEIGKLKEEVTPLTTTVAEMKPHVDEYAKYKERVLGAKIVLGVLGTIGASLIGFGIWVVTHWSQWVHTVPPRP